MLCGQQRLVCPELHGLATFEYFRRGLVVLQRRNAALFGIRKDGKLARDEFARRVRVGFEVKPAVVNRGDEQVVAIDVDTTEHAPVAKHAHS